MSILMPALSIPIMMFMGVMIGFLQLFTVFGALFAFPVFGLTVGALITERYQKSTAAIVCALTAAIGSWLSFLIELLSRRGGVAGFPISALELPLPSMGDDHLPVDLWGATFANHGIWILAGLVVALVIVAITKKRISAKAILPFSLTLSVLAVLYHLALFAMWYD